MVSRRILQCRKKSTYKNYISLPFKILNHTILKAAFISTLLYLFGAIVKNSHSPFILTSPLAIVRQLVYSEAEILCAQALVLKLFQKRYNALFVRLHLRKK